MFTSLKKTFKDCLRFIKNPIDVQDSNQSNLHKFKRLLSLLVLEIPLMVLLSLLMTFFEKMDWVNLENHSVINLIENTPIWLVFILAVIAIPFLEELVFRLPLRYKRNYILRGLHAVSPNIIQRVWHKGYVYFFYLMAVSFALIHLVNYDLTGINLFVLPFLILPQFILALLIGYLRVRYNFFLGYLMHAIHNAIFIGISLWTTANVNTEKLKIDTDSYSLKIEETSFQKEVHISYDINKISFKAVELKNIVATLSDKNTDLISSNKNSMMNKKFIIDYRKHTSEAINSDSIILAQLGEMYHFKIDTSKVNQEVKLLTITNNEKLYNHQSNQDNDDVNITQRKKQITIENGSLETLVQTLNINFKNRYDLNVTSTDKFDFVIPTDAKDLENTLLETYGIDFIPIEKQVEHLEVNFE